MSGIRVKFIRLHGLLGDPALQRAVRRLALASVSALLLWQTGCTGEMATGLGNLVKMAVDGLIILAALAMTFAIAFTGVMGIFAKMAGMPYAEATATMKVIGVVILFILTAFTIPVANAVIDAVMEYRSPEGIHIPDM